MEKGIREDHQGDQREEAEEASQYHDADFATYAGCGGMPIGIE